MSTVIVSALMVLSWLVPNHYYPWSTFYNDWLMWCGLLFLAGCLVVNGRKTGQLFPNITWVILFSSAIPLLQWGAGFIFFGGDALTASLYLAGLAVAIWAGANLANTTNFSEAFAWLISTGALVSFFLAFHQWLGLDYLGIWLIDMPTGGRPYANLAQPNNLASLLCMGLVASLYLRERGILGRGVVALVLFLFCAGIAMTRSRMSIIVILVLAIWLLWAIKRLQLCFTKGEVVAGVGMFLSLWLAWPTISEFLYLSADSSLARLEGAVSGEVRWILWQQLLDAAMREPWLGYGWNQVSVAQMVVAAEYPSSVYTEHAHNLVVDMLCWNGLPLGGVIVACGSWWLYSRLQYVNSAVGWFGMAIVLTLLTHSMFEFPLDYGIFLVPFGLAVGLVEAGHGGRMVQLPRAVLALVPVSGLAIAVWIFVEYQAVQADYTRLRYESAGIELRSPDHIAPDVVLLTQSQEFIRFARTEATKGMSLKELEWMRKVAFRYAYPPVMFRYALALGLNGRYEEAGTQLMRLRQLHPPVRYQEALEGWTVLAEKFPELGNVAVPSVISR